MKIKSFLAISFLLVASYSYGQASILNAKTPAEIGRETAAKVYKDNTSKPIPYDHVDQRDILWAKGVWEYIDLNQRVNFPLLYPIDNNSGMYHSLYNVLLANIENGNIKHVYADSYFKHEITLNQLGATLHETDTTDAGYKQLNAGDELDQQFVTRTDVSAADVQGYRIRGYWYFDSRESELRYRLIGIAPVVTDAHSKAMGITNAPPVTLFWVFYPEVRDILFHAKVYNPSNSAHPLNFDQLLIARRFHAVIYKDDNVQGDRAIADYMGNSALKQLLEARRTKNEIRNFEVNMWNY